MITHLVISINNLKTRAISARGYWPSTMRNVISIVNSQPFDQTKYNHYVVVLPINHLWFDSS